MQRKQKNRTYNQKKNQFTERDPQMGKLMELADKDAKAAVINMLHVLRSVEENMNTMRRKMEGF